MREVLRRTKQPVRLAVRCINVELPNETSMAEAPPEPMKIDAIDPEAHQVQG
jgi:hypothetical protein